MTAAGRGESDGQGRQAHATAVRAMFDRISPTYDWLNRALSWGIDRRWRTRAAERLVHALRGRDEGPVLDICAGTLDLSRALREALRDDRQQRMLVAGDFSRAMLLAGIRKRERVGDGRPESPAEGGERPARRRETDPRLVLCDALRLPFAQDSFEGVICGFGLRNLSDPGAGIREIHRVLRPGGALVVLEFCRPTSATSRLLHALYARHLLPLVGGAVSGDASAYRYLARTMRGFLSRAELEAAMRERGFCEVHGCELTLGVASMVASVKD